MTTKTYNPKSNGRNNLNDAIDEAMKLPTEYERMLAVIETIRCYKNEYNAGFDNDQKLLHEGYEKCRSGIGKIQAKVKERLLHNFSQKNQS